MLSQHEMLFAQNLSGKEGLKDVDIWDRQRITYNKTQKRSVNVDFGLTSPITHITIRDACKVFSPTSVIKNIETVPMLIFSSIETLKPAVCVSL